MLRAHDTLSYSTIGILLSFLEAQGHNVAAFCEQLNIPREPPENPDTRISLDLMLQAWRLAYQVTANPALALEVGAQSPVSSLGTFGYVLIHCDTVEQALRAACRYFLLVSGGMSLRLEDRAGSLALVAENDESPGECWIPVVERTFAATVAILRHETGGRADPASAEYSYSRPRYAERYRRYLGPIHRFDRQRDALLFDRAVLPLRPAHRHPRLQSVFAREAAASLDSLQAPESLTERLRAMVPELMSLGCCTARDAARRLAVSERTLHRRLAEGRTTFQQTIDEVRKSTCLSLLSQQKLTMEEIAFACGFSEASGFFRAFKRWTGAAPSAFRRTEILSAGRA